MSPVQPFFVLPLAVSCGGVTVAKTERVILQIWGVSSFTTRLHRGVFNLVLLALAATPQVPTSGAHHGSKYLHFCYFAVGCNCTCVNSYPLKRVGWLLTTTSIKSMSFLLCILYTNRVHSDSAADCRFRRLLLALHTSARQWALSQRHALEAHAAIFPPRHVTIPAPSHPC